MSHTYKIDDSIVFKRVDDTLASLDINTLEKVREELIKKGEDTELIDKAIIERKRRDEIIKEKNKEHDKEMRKLSRMALLSGLFGGLISKNSNSSSDLMSWEEDAIKNDGYKDYNFEEEELEEDDFYYEDDK